MEAFAYIPFVLVTLGPLVAYAIYTALRGEPRRPDKPAKRAGTGPSTPESSTP